MMRCLLAFCGGLLLRGPGAPLRRRSCCAPLLLLLGAALCLFYHALVLSRNRNRLRAGPKHQEQEEAHSRRPSQGAGGAGGLMESRSWICSLEALLREDQVHTSSQRPPQRVVVLTGRLPPSDTEVQLYHRVLQALHYQVHMSRYTETSSLLKRQHTGDGGWSLLLCLSSAERSCLRRISFSHLHRHQMVNLLPPLMEAFSDAGGGLCGFIARSQPTGSDLSMRPHSCGSSNQKLQIQLDSDSPVQAPPPALVAMVNVYILVTPLTSFLHDISVVTTNQQLRGRPVKLRDFLLEHLDAETSHEALEQVKKVIGEVLEAALTNEKEQPAGRCILCFQLLTFTLMFSGSITPLVVQVDTELTFWSLSDDAFERQITKDLILEDTLNFLLPPHTHLQQYGGCRGKQEVCLSEEELILLLQFHHQMQTTSAFQMLYPSTSSSLSPPGLSELLLFLAHHYDLQTNSSCSSNQQPAPPSPQNEGVCVDPVLRQVYTDPPLILVPAFSGGVKEYRAEVSFDTVMIRIRPEPVSPACNVHLDEHRGPRMANYPVGLGDSRISILVTDDGDPEAPVIMTIYTIHVFRESRPSLPMFGDHVTCSFLQDCGLQVQPGVSCGLQPHMEFQSSLQTCSSGHVPGRWVVPCLSCSDNRTCDWREVAWQPDGCSHQLVERPLLQDCMKDRKVLFIGDSTNRGMMYFLMERVNSSLEDWGKAHDTLVYRNLNGGRTQVSYSYYPQFWLEKTERPTFRQALLQLLHRSQPLVNSNLTALVVGGVQWLNTDHLRTVQEVLDRESLGNIVVVVKSLGMGFQLPVDGIRSLSLMEIQGLYQENQNIITAAEHHGYEAIDTFSITLGRYKEFLQGRCACHFHEVTKVWSLKPLDSLMSTTNTTRTLTTPGLSSQSDMLDAKEEVGSNPPTYHVRGAVNQVYSEILLSRLCARTRT